MSYTYDGVHHVLTRTDAKSQQTQYSYDTLGRLTLVKHGTVSGITFTEDPTAEVSYTYDPYGRTSSVGFGAKDLNFARSYTYGYTYNTAGRVLTQTMGWNMNDRDEYGNLITATESFGMTYQWDNEGKMTSYTDLAGVWFSYQYDGLGRATNLTGQCAVYVSGQCTNQVYATASYGPANQVLTLSDTATYAGGGGYTYENRQYNSLMQLTHLSATGALQMDMTYNYPTNNNGRIASSVDAVSGQTVNYTYDALNRLTSAQTTNGAWGESYGYDGFGNLTGMTGTGTGESWSAPVTDASTNRLLGVNYDANGNQIGDQLYSNYVWDVENRLVQQLTAGSGGTWYGGTAYSYDPSGRRVLKNGNWDPAGTNGGDGYTSGTWEFYFYGLGGQKMGTINCVYGRSQFGWPILGASGCTVGSQRTYFGGKLIVEGNATLAVDRLGSIRGDQQAPHREYYPYGAGQTSPTGGGFATYIRDAAGQDYAEQRYYNAGMGRFWSPDPGGLKTSDPTDPGSWNRYAYVEGDPVNFGDPDGTNRVVVWQTLCTSIPTPEGLSSLLNCQIAPIATVTTGNSKSAFPECNPTGDPVKEKNLQFIVDHFDDAATVGSVNHVSGDWVLAWAAEESGSKDAKGHGLGWGTGFGPKQGNFFSEHPGAWDNSVACGKGPNPLLACFNSFYDSASAAFSSYGGKYGTILTNAYAAGETAAQAFQAVADKGWNTNSGYGIEIQAVLRAVDSMLGCLSNNGYLQ